MAVLPVSTLIDESAGIPVGVPIMLRADVAIVDGEDASVMFRDHLVFSLTGTAGSVIRALESIVDEARTVRELARQSGTNPVDVSMILAVLTSIRRLGLLEYRWGSDRDIGIRPLVDRMVLPAPEIADGAALMLSPFATIHQEGEAIVVESPISAGVLRMPPARAADVIDAGIIDARAPRDVIELLVALDLLVDRSRGHLDLSPTWEPRDLKFQHFSRTSESSLTRGATFRFGRANPPTADAPPTDCERILIPRPDLVVLAAEDPSLTTVLEQRRSIRRQGDQPLSMQQLGAFLFRALAVRRTLDSESPLALVQRVFPMGGAIDALDHLIVSRTGGTVLETGVYRYDKYKHALIRTRASAEQANRLADAASAGWGMNEPAPPSQVVVVTTAKPAQLAWKYESIALRACLKSYGCAVATMYLVATAMGLAPCAVGGGAGALFHEATGIDSLVECIMGEFTLGNVDVAMAPATDCDLTPALAQTESLSPGACVSASPPSSQPS